MIQVKCPKCAALIQKNAKVCRYCGTKSGSPAGIIIGFIALGSIILFYFGGDGSDHSEQAGVELLSSQVRQQCGEQIRNALKSGVITKRPSPNRIDMPDPTWADIGADTKRHTMSAVACDVYGKKLGDLSAGEYVVVYGSISGKRLATISSAGIDFE